MINHSRLWKILFLNTLMLAGLFVFVSFASGRDPAHGILEEIKHGAQLYDKWYELKGTTPQGNHPLYPAVGKKSGETTWRCKECHGWDYNGKDGRYSSGSHFTGISGTLSATSKNDSEIRSVLTSPEHAFEDEFNDQDFNALIAFIRNGQIDFSRAIGPDGQGTGNVENGQKLYIKNCGSCHGNDGNLMDFNSKKDGIQGVGWLANDNPQETLHKIRWGHPGSDMPSMIADRELSDAATIDILTYAQTLHK